jgi:hypothetical protein
MVNKKLRIWEQPERPLLEAHGFLAATINSSAVTIGSSSLDQYHGCTVRSSIADSTVAPDETNTKPDELQVYEKRMLRPGFEPGISDSRIIGMTAS